MSLLLAVVMVVSLFTIIPVSAATDEDLVDALAALYDGDEERAKSDLEAMRASGLIDDDGKVDIFDASLIQRWIAGDELAQSYGIGQKLAS